MLPASHDTPIPNSFMPFQFSNNTSPTILKDVKIINVGYVFAKNRKHHVWLFTNIYNVCLHFIMKCCWIISNAFLHLIHPSAAYN